MPIDFRWLDDDHTLNLWTLGETFTWEEFEAVSYRAASDRPFYEIADCSRLENLPAAFLSRIPRAIAATAGNLRLAVVVGLRPGFVKSVAEIVAGLFPRVRFAATVDEALALIEADRRVLTPAAESTGDPRAD